MADADGNRVSVIDERTDTVAATIHLGPFTQPDGVAVNPATGNVYVTDNENDTVSVLAPCPS